MFLGIHHVAIICSDYFVSKHFYADILQLEVIAETYREERDSYKLDLKLPDGSQIELFSFPKSPTRPSYPEAQGLRHLAFSVINLYEVVNQLISKNITVEEIRIDELTGKQYTFFQDPDGLPLELYQH